MRIGNDQNFRFSALFHTPFNDFFPLFFRGGFISHSLCFQPVFDHFTYRERRQRLTIKQLTYRVSHKNTINGAYKPIPKSMDYEFSLSWQIRSLFQPIIYKQDEKNGKFVFRLPLQAIRENSVYMFMFLIVYKLWYLNTFSSSNFQVGFSLGFLY